MNELVTLEQAKSYLKIDSDAEDETINLIISAATKKAEDYAGYCFVIRDVIETHIGDGKNVLRLYKQPVSKVNSVFIDGEEIDDYEEKLSIGRLYRGAWDKNSEIVVSYEAGYLAIYDDDLSELQEMFPNAVLAVLLIINDLYENRGDTVGAVSISGLGSVSYNIPSRAAELLNPLRTRIC